MGCVNAFVKPPIFLSGLEVFCFIPTVDFCCLQASVSYILWLTCLCPVPKMASCGVKKRWGQIFLLCFHANFRRTWRNHMFRMFDACCIRRLTCVCTTVQSLHFLLLETYFTAHILTERYQKRIHDIIRCTLYVAHVTDNFAVPFNNYSTANKRKDRNNSNCRVCVPGVGKNSLFILWSESAGGVLKFQLRFRVNTEPVWFRWLLGSNVYQMTMQRLYGLTSRRKCHGSQAVCCLVNYRLPYKRLQLSIMSSK